jgi:hypothetical protein
MTEPDRRVAPLSLSEEKAKRAQELRKTAIEALRELAALVAEANGRDPGQTTQVTVNLTEVATFDDSVPPVSNQCEVFRDSDGSCTGMYCDPPGACFPCIPMTLAPG